MKTKNLFIILGIVFVVLVGVILILNQLGLLAIITNTTPWVDEESRVTWDGEWSLQNPVTKAFDENWGTPTVLHTTYKEANIYEHFILDYPQDAMVDYIEFQVRYDITLFPELKDAYASINYYVWNYRTSSWNKIYEDSVDGGVMTPIFKASAIDHIQNKEVRLRTHATVGFLQVVWVFESKARLGYSFEVDCNIGETKCNGANNREYFICENYEWKNLGPTIGECGAECILNSNCPSGGYTGEKYCLNNSVVQKYVSYPCIEYQCVYSLTEKVIKTCEFGCENGECLVSPPPIPPRPPIIEWLANIWQSIVDWFKGLFGG